MDNRKKGIGRVIAAIVVISVVVIMCIQASANQNFYFRVIDNSGDNSDATGTPRFTQDNGEFYLDVNKTVFDPETGEWVKEIDARVGDTVTFRIIGIIENYPDFCGGQFFENFSFLEDYSSDIFYSSPIQIAIRVDENNLTMNATYDVTVVGCGVGYNTLNWTAICPDTGEVATDEETVMVNVICPEAPLLTPIGLIALVGLLSAIAAVAIVRKRR